MRTVTFEPLEGRTLMAAVATVTADVAVVRPAILVFRGPPLPASQTLLSVHAGRVGQAITITVTVRDRADSGPPAGTVDLVAAGVVLQTLTLTPGTSSAPDRGRSTATYTVAAGAASMAYRVGRHTLTAVYAGDNQRQGSRARATFRVTKYPSRDEPRVFTD